jgi:hypothetical protein
LPSQWSKVVGIFVALYDGGIGGSQEDEAGGKYGPISTGSVAEAAENKGCSPYKSTQTNSGFFTGFLSESQLISKPLNMINNLKFLSQRRG